MTKNKSIRCWGDDRKCDAVLPDDREETMRRLGWGWLQARDDFAPSGTGPYFACPDHKQF